MYTHLVLRNHHVRGFVASTSDGKYTAWGKTTVEAWFNLRDMLVSKGLMRSWLTPIGGAIVFDNTAKDRVNAL